MITGVEHIAEERQHQIVDKGYDAEFIKAHPEYYAQGQLVFAAVFCLTGDTKYIPSNWPWEDINKLYEHEDVKMMEVAGALLAAEIDRLQSL